MRPPFNHSGAFGLLLLLALLSFGGATCQEAPGEPFVAFARTGGHLGFDDRVTVYKDQRAVIERNGNRRTIVLPEPRWVALRSLVRSTDFSGFQQQAVRGDGTRQLARADYVNYTLRYAGRAYETNDAIIPEAYKPVASLLAAIIEDYAGDLGPGAEPVE